ncbi:hypothetical protein ILYODFUR_032558 [Ilyodon furcidens]|uniref:Uncharacterized protein n=1 Tax=Ilyodon furcidens TaxID=33524 RepID=A0ABV0UKW9_9TELE
MDGFKQKNVFDTIFSFSIPIQIWNPADSLSRVSLFRGFLGMSHCRRPWGTPGASWMDYILFLSWEDLVNPQNKLQTGHPSDHSSHKEELHYNLLSNVCNIIMVKKWT